MALYRCAVCGSPHVHKEENNNGFSYKKALIGTAVFGAVGAVAGINGKTTVAYTCSDCDSVMPEPMDKYTLDLIEMALSTPSILSDSLKKLVNKYPYVTQEINEKLKAADPYLNQSSSTSYGVTTVSEEVFVTAAEKAFYLFRAGGADKLYKQIEQGERNFDASIIDSNKVQLAEAIQALPIVYSNFQYYTHCILPDRDPNAPINLFEKKPFHLSMHNLQRAITYYILHNYGDMSPSELYDYVNDDNIAKRNFDIFIGEKVRESYSFEKECHPNLYSDKQSQARLHKSVWLLKARYHSMMGNYCADEEPLKLVKFIIRDGLLYARNPQSEEEFTEQVTQKRQEAVPAALKQEMYNNRLQSAGIRIPTQLPVTSEEENIQRDILRIGREIAEHQETIEKLGKKIFGKKKAMAEIDRLNAIIQECNNRTKRLKEEAASLENERNCRLDELQQKARKQQRELDDAYAGLTAQKEEYIRQFDKENAIYYDAWICLEKKPS